MEQQLLFSLRSLSRRGLLFVSSPKGGAQSGGKLILNRSLICSSVDAIDYVITHELCHLRHNHHGAEFFAFLDRVRTGKSAKSNLNGNWHETLHVKECNRTATLLNGEFSTPRRRNSPNIAFSGGLYRFRQG
jgi:predicted SprT family Zn-dependent metalloprotease